MERDGRSPCITVLQGRSTTVLEMEHPVVNFITICESPWSSGMCVFLISIFNFHLCKIYLFISTLFYIVSHLYRNARTICHSCTFAK